MVAVLAFTALMFDMVEREPNTQETTRRKERLRKNIIFLPLHTLSLMIHVYYYTDITTFHSTTFLREKKEKGWFWFFGDIGGKIHR